MAYCSKCGHQISDGAQFCSMCGTPIPREANQRKEAFDGTVHRCPNCGQVLGAFSTVCPSCGYELRNTQAATSLRELFTRIEEITSQSSGGVKQTLLERLRRDTTDTDDRAAALIKAFPIPNTREDLIEFIITSASNINVDAFNELKRSNLSSSDIAMSNAWLSKLEQAYQKASITLSGDVTFEKIKALYDSTMKKVSWAKCAMIPFWIGLVVFWIVVVVIAVLSTLK